MKKMLIVDDTEERYIAVKPMLEDIGYNITIANNRKSATKILNKESFDILWIDIFMPDNMNSRMSGIILIKEILDNCYPNNPKRTPIIVPTAYPSEIIGSSIVMQSNIVIIPLPAPAEILVGTISKLVD